MAEVNDADGSAHVPGHEGITLWCPLSCLGLRTVGDLVRLLVETGRTAASQPHSSPMPTDGPHEHERVTFECPVTCLGLSRHVLHALSARGDAPTVGEVLRMLESGKLGDVRNIGRRRTGEIRTALIAAGFSASRYPSLRSDGRLG
ncbi:hypothetical protein [Actinomadura sp. 6K520]|uniref:hypothetical protein n=1 Tax=Actinomadura sp. 6K520 TaxID=2530364 RepID=UPI00104860C6|nr:hypothetical protein [Actinomadura sp. 6K520]TDE26445.1 hypothetical protein E1289_25570 [Actinomadura sp. 6K520]